MLADTKKRELKRQLLAHCLRLQEENADNLRAMILDVTESVDNQGQPVDGFDAYRSVQMDRRDLFAQQLDKAIMDMQVLQRMDGSLLCREVRFGAVVRTREQNIFVAIGLGRVNLDGDCYFVISTQVPFYHAMAGKREGDAFEFRGREHTILEVF